MNILYIVASEQVNRDLVNSHVFHTYTWHTCMVLLPNVFI